MSTIENYDRIQADLNHEVDLNTYIVGEDGQERESILGISMAISFIMGFVIYIFVTMFGNMVMTSVINEKSNKIVEVIVSSVKPFDLMIGKILGVASVALTQFFIWVDPVLHLGGPDPGHRIRLPACHGTGTDERSRGHGADDPDGRNGL